jgi:hypothetical protein
MHGVTWRSQFPLDNRKVAVWTAGDPSSGFVPDRQAPCPELHLQPRGLGEGRSRLRSGSGGGWGRRPPVPTAPPPPLGMHLRPDAAGRDSTVAERPAKGRRSHGCGRCGGMSARSGRPFLGTWRVGALPAAGTDTWWSARLGARGARPGRSSRSAAASSPAPRVPPPAPGSPPERQRPRPL